MELLVDQNIDLNGLEIFVFLKSILKTFVVRIDVYFLFKNRFTYYNNSFISLLVFKVLLNKIFFIKCTIHVQR